MMICEICSSSREDSTYPLVSESQFWLVKLAPNQSLLGRCVVAARRHVGDLAELTPAEMTDFLQVVRQLEGAIKQSLGATMFNWSCYMNLAYQADPPDPHVHWWLAPRYRQPVEVHGILFEDPHFGHPYDHRRWQEVTPEVRDYLVSEIRRGITPAPPAAG
jgi:diadenosine tetraphosphate (Ap4A) HIT family hydrolase